MRLEQNMDMIAIRVPFLKGDVVLWLDGLKNLAQTGGNDIIYHLASVLDHQNQVIVHQEH